jgi:hypothetical protein
VLVKNLGEPPLPSPKGDPNFSIDTMDSNWHTIQYVMVFMDLNNVHVDLHDGHVDLHKAGRVDFAVWSCKYIGLGTCPSLDPTGLLHCALYRGELNRRRKGHRNLTIKYVHAICTVEEVKPTKSLL